MLNLHQMALDRCRLIILVLVIPVLIIHHTNLIDRLSQMNWESLPFATTDEIKRSLLLKGVLDSKNYSPQTRQFMLNNNQPFGDLVSPVHLIEMNKKIFNLEKFGLIKTFF